MSSLFFFISTHDTHLCSLHIPTHVHTPDSLADEVVEDACPQFWLMQSRRRVSERAEEIRREGKAIGLDRPAPENGQIQDSALRRIQPEQSLPERIALFPFSGEMP